MSQEQISHTSNISSVDFLAEAIGHEPLGETNGIVTGDASATAGLRAGTVMGKVTATSKLVPYNNGASDGSEVAVGILSQDIALKDRYVTDSAGAKTAKDMPCTLYTKGSVIESLLTGIDAAAKTDLSDMTFV